MFTQDNTEGFTDAQIAAMNAELYEALMVYTVDDTMTVEDYENAKQAHAEAVLKRHGGA